MTRTAADVWHGADAEWRERIRSFAPDLGAALDREVPTEFQQNALDRAIVKPVFLSDEEWGAIDSMAQRGIADADDYANYVDRHPSAEDDPVAFATNLRRDAKRAVEALAMAGRRSSRG